MFDLEHDFAKVNKNCHKRTKQAWKSFSELWSRKGKLINVFASQHCSAALLSTKIKWEKLIQQNVIFKLLATKYFPEWLSSDSSVTQHWLSIVLALLSTKIESEPYLWCKTPPIKHFSGRLSGDSAVLSSENLHKHSLNQVLLESAKKFGILQTVKEEFALKIFL